MTGVGDLGHALPDGRALALLPERAAFLADGLDGPAGLLLVADVHFGKAASFRRLGVPVPAGTTEANLARLDQLIRRLPARRLVFLGDFLHAATGRAAGTLQALRDWRARHAHLPMTLVRGNHDDHAGDPPAELDIESVDEPWPCAGLLLCHDLDSIRATADTSPTSDRSRPYAIGGHLHPVLRLGHGLDSLRLPCFHARSHGMVLPAFGEFTGGAPVRPEPGERLYGVGGERVLAVAVPQARAD